jgi:SAM-dependent methyltransferase
MAETPTATLEIPQYIYDAVVESHCVFFERISGIDRHKYADDLLSPLKAHQQAAILLRYTKLHGSRLLEVGAGLAINLLVWAKFYEADVYGIEPDAVGFDASFKLGRTLMELNGLSPDRVRDAVGEALPFGDNMFDIVYSTNVLEHTTYPLKVLEESLRVLRPGGTLQFVFPSYGSYFDGHYGVFHPPIPWPGFFPWYVRWVWGRDPAFARTLRTELNVGWTRRALRELSKKYSFEVLGLGEDIFRERMVTLDFGAWANLVQIRRVLTVLGHSRVRAVLADLIIALRGWSPIILTLRKSP